MEVDGEEKRVQVRFVTNLKRPFKAPATAITVPANSTRLGLSSIVNSILRALDPEWNDQPFDFLIDGELVRMHLDELLLAKGISAERILEIEYIRAVYPSKDENPSLHDDWVSSVDGSFPGFIMTGCYDRFGRIWKSSGVCSHILAGHSDAITCVSVIDSQASDRVIVATASKDRTMRLWKVDTEEPTDQPENLTAFKVLRGHSGSVQSVAPQASGSMICSGSWDCSINLWKTDEPDTVSIKKRKVKKKDTQVLSEGEAVSSLVGHTQQVSSVVWPEHSTIYSASWDHSLRTWDVETGTDTAKIFCGKALSCLHVGGEGSALIAAGGSDSILRVWDSRKPGTSAPAYQFAGHNSWISACKWHDKSQFHLLSASYDGKIMLWDIRTAWRLFAIGSHEDKVLCADWWKGDSIVSGGADNKLCISGEVSIQ